MKGPQKGALRRGVYVLLCTPGRVTDLMEDQYLNLPGVRFINLEEAEEILSIGFQDAVEKILTACTSEEMKKMLLFRATIPHWVKELALKYMRFDDTVNVDALSDTKKPTSNEIACFAVVCPTSERGDAIADVIKFHTGVFGKSIITDKGLKANEVANMGQVVSVLGGAGVLNG